MKGRIFLAEKRGFCSGVERAVRLVDEAVKNGPRPVRVLHEIVHNDDVVRHFAELGVQFFEEPDASWQGGTLVLSAHGVGAELEQMVRSLPVRVVDAACPLVKRLQSAAAELEQKGYHLILAGKRAHRETEGVVGRVVIPPVILENTAEAKAFQPVSGKRYAVISQTTLSQDEYNAILRELSAKIPDLYVSGGICTATTSRQNAVKRLALKCKRIIVIGSMKSSNSKRLREVAEAAGAEAVLIPDADALPDCWLKQDGDIGITSGASAPERLVQELIRKLEISGWVSASEDIEQNPVR